MGFKDLRQYAYYQEPNGLLFMGDTIEWMSKFPDKSVDLVITSPPYNAKKEYENYLSLEEYQEFATKWISQIKRILTNSGNFWLNVGYTKTGNNTTLPLTYLYYSLIDIPFIQEIVWHYEGGMSYKKRFTHRTERWMWFSNNPDKMTFNLDDVRDTSLNRTKDKRNNPLGKNPTDYWYFDRVVSGSGKTKEKKNHPCQFPEKMIERIVLACSNIHDVVLDNFSGSGTTAVVCKNTNRRWVCIEKEEKYCKITVDRLSAGSFTANNCQH